MNKTVLIVLLAFSELAVPIAITPRLAGYSLAGSGIGPEPSVAASLYDQSIADVLRNRFKTSKLSYLLFDLVAERIAAARWDDLDRPIPAGSLIKPFVALAYAQSHGFHYPELLCGGTADKCWYPRGHGRIGIYEAFAYSCNTYFRKLAQETKRDELDQVAFGYGIAYPAASLSPAALIGLGPEVELTPLQILRAYIQLASRRGTPGVTELLQGMALSAQAGTANALQRSLRGEPVLAKTGTARCVHTPRAPGDGYTIVLYPADSPRLALLVRLHGGPGAHAAEIAGVMLRAAVSGTTEPEE
jgi:cell division protein FtsI/penicillin-binding protein 2